MRILKVAAANLVIALASTAALAHAFLDHAEPRVGSTVSSAPRELVLAYTQNLEPAFSSVEVSDSKGEACDAGSRFSTLGILAVCILLISGMINVSFLLGNMQNLTDTSLWPVAPSQVDAGRAMVGLAAINRQYLLPRICKTANDQSAFAVQTLARSTLIEIAAGLGIIIVVGILGITAPAIDMIAHVH
jgi:hypothetical protein